jgi:peroxiredoxin
LVITVHKMKAILTVAMITCLGFIVVARAAEAPATKPADPQAIPKVGEAAPDYNLKTYDDKPIELRTLTRSGPVVLVMLRGWPGYQCPICTKQVAQLMAKKSQLKDANAHVLLVYPGPAEKLREHAKDFLKQPLPANFDLAVDPDFVVVNQYGLRWNAAGETAYPSTFVLDKQGVVRFAKVSKTHGGRATAEEILKALGEIR